MTRVGWFASDEPLYLGMGEHLRGRIKFPRRLRLPTSHRLRHLYVVGSSGSGKSRFARLLLQQDITAGRGFTLVDSEDLGKETLAFIAKTAIASPLDDDELGDKLVLIEPAVQTHGVPGINLLEPRLGQTTYQLVDGIIGCIRSLWPDCYGPRLEDVCRNGLLLLSELGLTVVELVPLLSDPVFRAALVQRSRNAEVRLYFQEHLAGLRSAELKTWLESSRNKWNAFVANPLIRPILGQTRSTIDFSSILELGKWCLVNVSRDHLKESRRLLGALLVTLIHHAAIAREHVAPERRILHGLFCDEFQQYFCDSFLAMLEGSRKYGLALALFHQNLTQPPFDATPAAIDTIVANAHSLVAFNLGRKDAERLSREFFAPSGTAVKMQQRFLGIPLERPQFWSMSDEREHFTNELMTLGSAEAYVKYKGIGDDEPYALRVPYVAEIKVDKAKIDRLRAHVARRYYRPVAEVDREIEARWAAIRASGAAIVDNGGDYRR
jgi:hypothetical protein